MKAYRFVDVITQVYLGLVVLLILVGRQEAVPAWGGWLTAHLVTAVLVHALIRAAARRPANRILEGLRELYPLLLFAGLYRATGSLNQLFQTGYLDPVFRRLDELIFGMSPGFSLMAAFPFLGVSELLHAAYFSYYVMIAGVGVALYFRSRAGLGHYVAVVSLVFYACYLAYIFLPVVGPRGYYPELAEVMLPSGGAPVPAYPEAVQAGVFFQLMAWIYRHCEAPGAAFPSSHVAVAWVTLWFSWRYLRPVRWVHLLAVVLLCVATVYCRYHYVVDVVAGGIAAAVLLPLGHLLYARGRAAGASVQTGRS